MTDKNNPVGWFEIPVADMQRANMHSVAFLRAVNVGGKTLGVKALADKLGVINVAAAGTFIGERSAAGLKREIALALPFATEVFVCPGDEILALVYSNFFGARLPAANIKRFVSILETPPSVPPRLPVEKPDGQLWEVRIAAIASRYALSLRCRRHPRALYPNAVVERALGMAATTRGWETLVKVSGILHKLGTSR